MQYFKKPIKVFVLFIVFSIILCYNISADITKVTDADIRPENTTLRESNKYKNFINFLVYNQVGSVYYFDSYKEFITIYNEAKFIDGVTFSDIIGVDVDVYENRHNVNINLYDNYWNQKCYLFVYDGYCLFRLGGKVSIDAKINTSYLNNVYSDLYETIKKENIYVEGNEYLTCINIIDFICDNVFYDYTLSNKSFIEAIYENNTVCEGYAELFYIMCRICNLDVRYVKGYYNNELHAWNKVLVNGVWYDVDITLLDNGDTAINYLNETFDREVILCSKYLETIVYG